MVKEFTKPEVVSHIRDLNSGKYGVDLNLRATFDVSAESYRKLNTDKSVAMFTSHLVFAIS